MTTLEITVADAPEGKLVCIMGVGGPIAEIMVVDAVAAAREDGRNCAKIDLEESIRHGYEPLSVGETVVGEVDDGVMVHSGSEVTPELEAGGIPETEALWKPLNEWAALTVLGKGAERKEVWAAFREGYREALAEMASEYEVDYHLDEVDGELILDAPYPPRRGPRGGVCYFTNVSVAA